MYEVLNDNAVRPYKIREFADTEKFRPVAYIATFKKIVQGLTGLKELDVKA